MRLKVAGAANDAQVQNDNLHSDFTRNRRLSWLIGSLAPVLTLRRTCCLGGSIALLWRFRELPKDSLGSFLDF